MAINHGSLSARLTPKKTLKGTVQTATIAYESDYERLTNKPSINNIEVIGDLSLDDLGIVNNVQPDWEQDDTEAEDYIKNKPEIPDAQIQSDWEQTDEEAKDYIKNKPEIPSAQVQSDWNEADNTKPDFIKNKPTIPPEQVNSDWNAVSGKAQILNKPTIPSVIANPGNTTENLTSIGINGTNYAIQGGGGGGAVDSVNGKTGDVILDAEDVGALPNDTPLFSGDYDDLTNKPTIPDDLADLNEDSTHRLVTDTEKTTWNGKSDFSGSYTDLTDKPTLGTASAKDYVNSVVDGSSDLVTSDAVHDYVDSAISGVYKPSGNKTCSELLPALLIASNLGNVYNMTDSGVTTSDFVEGAGKTIEIGDNVVIVDVGTQNNATYKFDLLSGMVDLSNYIQKSATSGLMKNDGSVDTNSYATTSQIPDITGKADKVTSAVEGNFAGLDSNGNLTDSGHKHSDYLTQHQDISGKADKVTGATNGNLAKLDANGNLADGGWSSDKTTTSATGNPISISGLKSNQLAINPIITLEPIQAGSGTPSPSNIRAISGYDKIEVLSVGKNVLPSSTIQNGTTNGLTHTVYKNQNGEVEKIVVSGKATAVSEIVIQLSLQLKNGEYILSGCPSGGGNNSFALDYLNTSYSQSRDTGSGVTFTVNDNAYYVRIRWFDTTNTYSNIEFKPMIRLSSITDATYEPYHKTTSISESLGQTVYGGSLDVRTGKFKVLGKAVDLGNLDYSYRGDIVTGVFSNSVVNDYVLSLTVKALCEKYNFFGTVPAVQSMADVPDKSFALYYQTGQTATALYIKDTSYNNATTFKASLSGVKLVYELATPFTPQLTPHEISLLKDYAYVSTNGTNIALDYHNGELASLADVAQVGETVNELEAISSVIPQAGAMNIANPNICKIIRQGKLVHLYISGTIEATSTGWGDTILTNIPTPSTLYGSVVSMMLTQSNGTCMPIQIQNGVIAKGSSSPSPLGWYIGNIMYFVD